MPSLSLQDCFFDRRVARAVQLALADLSIRRTLVQTAQGAGLNPTYFSRRFRQTTGITFATWNARVRVEEAKRLLAVVDLSITAVAASVGYVDQTTFARVFRRCEGRCPREYRRLLFAGGYGATTRNADRSARIAETLVEL